MGVRLSPTVCVYIPSGIIFFGQEGIAHRSKLNLNVKVMDSDTSFTAITFQVMWHILYPYFLGLSKVTSGQGFKSIRVKPLICS